MKVQITLTLDDLQVEALSDLADAKYEGNISMALRQFLKTNKLV
jgi:hypothetical protein